MQAHIEQMLRDAGHIALSYFQKEFTISTKQGRNDLLTDADTAVSDFFVEQIGKIYPDHHIYTEELAEDVNAGADWKWIIDPIDGTLAFAYGIPTWCILVAVLEKGEPRYAAAYSPVTNTLFFADVRQGIVTKDGHPIQIGNHATVDQSVGYAHVVGTKQYGVAATGMLAAMQQQGGRIRDTIGLIWAALVASGDFDFYMSNSGQVYDHMPIAIICEVAGATVTDFDGNPWKEGRQDILVANTALHAELLALVQQFK